MGALLKTFAADHYAAVLDSWTWAGVEGKSPVAVTLFGDIFLEDGEGVWFLDVVAGTVTCQWASWDAQVEIETDDGRRRWLLSELAWATEASGVSLGAEQVYDFTVPPVLSGPLAVENLVPADFVVAVDMAGQIHGQVKDLAPRTLVSGLKRRIAHRYSVDSSAARGRRGWRRS